MHAMQTPIILLILLICGSADTKDLVPSTLASSMFIHSEEEWGLAGARSEQEVHSSVRMGWTELAVEVRDDGNKAWYFAAPEAFRGEDHREYRFVIRPDSPPFLSGTGVGFCPSLWDLPSGHQT